MGSFKALLSKVKDDVKEIIYDDIPIEQKSVKYNYLEQKEWVTFEELFVNEKRRLGLIVVSLRTWIDTIRANYSLSKYPFWLIQIRKINNPELRQQKMLCKNL